MARDSGYSEVSAILAQRANLLKQALPGNRNKQASPVVPGRLTRAVPEKGRSCRGVLTLLVDGLVPGRSGRRGSGRAEGRNQQDAAAGDLLHVLQCGVLLPEPPFRSRSRLQRRRMLPAFMLRASRSARASLWPALWRALRTVFVPAPQSRMLPSRV